VTGLEFERTSVATGIVLDVGGRPQRVKVPNDAAPAVRQTLQEALFAFHDVASIEEFNRVRGTDESGEPDAEEGADDLTFGSGIDPLVTDREDDPARGVEDPFAAESAGEGTASDEPVADEGRDEPAAVDDPLSADGSPAPDADAGDGSAGADTGDEATGAEDRAATGSTQGSGGDADATTDDGGDETTTEARSGGAGTTGAPADAADTDDPADVGDDSATTEGRDEGADDRDARRGDDRDPAAADGQAVATREDVAAVGARLEELTDAVDRQNELLKRQHRAMKQLVEELEDE